LHLWLPANFRNKKAWKNGFQIQLIEISGLQESGFDMGILSFSDKELTQLLNVNIEQGMTDSDSVPEPPEQSVTQKR
jgi:hypothetical protein